MPELNKANRQVCDVDIRFLKTMAPFMFFETANATTMGIDSSVVFARAKGTNRIPFHDPLTGTMSIEAQVYPFKFFALMSDGTIANEALYADVATIKCETAGELSLTVKNGTIQAGTVFAYPVDSYGDESAMIAGTFANDKFTATSAEKIVAGDTYRVGYVVNRTGVKKVSFNNKKLPRDYYITMSTVDKDENDLLVPFKITAHKAAVQRSFEISFSSEGDPATVTMTFDLLESKDGDFVDMIEIEDDAT